MEASNVIAFPIDRQTTHPLVKSVTEVMIGLGNLARQIESWPMDHEAKLSMLSTIKTVALQACELQLAAVSEATDSEKFRKI